jgi:hypothetical protein
MTVHLLFGARVETPQSMNDTVSKATGTAGRLFEANTASKGKPPLYAVFSVRRTQRKPPVQFIPTLPNGAAGAPTRRPAVSGLLNGIDHRLGRLYACFDTPGEGVAP